MLRESGGFLRNRHGTWDLGIEARRGRGGAGECKGGDTGLRCWWSIAKRQATSLIARKCCKSDGDNRRKKFWGMLASVVAGMRWGGSTFRWFLVERMRDLGRGDCERGGISDLKFEI